MSLSFERQQLEEKLLDSENRLGKATQQITQLENQIKELEILSRRASRSKQLAFRYNYRLRLSVLTGIKMMYSHYCSSKQEETNLLRSQVYGEYLEDTHRNESI
ncbi:unnamed protein product [Lepeophtheirus salmonis]|uniref:(salmon louse) hypothetical protein n=1 Tax=Lepeophtheirus salmonis TaxID=72036 RepID=A0A7R8CCG9_LEPSM|nr:unnamed protein product [Lepeophtheirus salmonis]CAF2768634.1 unnamed protein product [Lepeophtheirus salmonis]